MPVAGAGLRGHGRTLTANYHEINLEVSGAHLVLWVSFSATLE